MAKSQMIYVSSITELESRIPGYISQGYTVANRSTDSVILVKKKSFSMLMAVIGFFLAVLPLLVYIVIYMLQSDKMVEIRVSQAQS